VPFASPNDWLRESTYRKDIFASYKNPSEILEHINVSIRGVSSSEWAVH
jgi:hypothetical protein